MIAQPRRKSLQYVVKISKFCNLRCTYCYEYAELGLKHRMSLDQIATMFKHAADHVESNKLDDLSFVWHGGEPFLVLDHQHPHPSPPSTRSVWRSWHAEPEIPVRVRSQGCRSPAEQTLNVAERAFRS